jgi:hypothetical protein
MTKNSPRIYLYKITFEEVSYYYYGVHKEKTYNEYYMGSPITHKWCWDFYTPKKQILQLFDFTDEGWIEAQEVETRLIRPFYNEDKWCLNESCGGKVSLKVLKENGRKLVEKIKEENIGIFAMTQEELSKAGRKGGKIGGQKNKENKTGYMGRSREKMTEDGKKGAQKVQELGIGIFALTSEELSASAKKAYANGLGKLPKEVRSEYGRMGARVQKKNGTGIFSLTAEQRIENGKKSYESGTGIYSLTREELKEITNRKYECCETGYISNAAGVVRYQKAKGIDTSKRKRIS